MDVLAEISQKLLNGKKSVELIKERAHRNYFEMNGHKFLQLSVRRFCEDVCSSIETWLTDVGSDSIVQNRLAETVKIKASASRFGVHFA
jgi:hypothetical protein